MLFLPSQYFSLNFKYFPLKTSWVSNAFSMKLLNLVQILLYFSNNSLFLISKDMHLVSLKVLHVHLFLGAGCIISLIFLSSMCPMKNLASAFLFLPYADESDITTLLMSHIVYSYWTFGRMKLLLFNFIAIFLYHT